MDTQTDHNGNSGAVHYKNVRIAHWDKIAETLDKWGRFNAYYHERLREVVRFSVPSGQRVMEIGCGTGDLLASLDPSYGVGIDFSTAMIKQAKTRHPHLHFVTADAHELQLQETFDYIIIPMSLMSYGMFRLFCRRYCL